MTNDSLIIPIADALGVSPFVALAVVLGLGLAVAALAARILCQIEGGR